MKKDKIELVELVGTIKFFPINLSFKFILKYKFVTQDLFSALISTSNLQVITFHEIYLVVSFFISPLKQKL